MRKNVSRNISLRQYRLTDLFLFAVILIVFEVILHFAFQAFHGDFIFSPMLAITLIVMMRWGWPAVFYAVGDGLLYCLLNIKDPNFSPYMFAIYIIGNAFVALLFFMTGFMGKKKIRDKWYFSLLFTTAGWIAVVLGRAVTAACFGLNFVSALLAHFGDLVSFAVCLTVILVMRRLDGMFEDQKAFLKRLDEERKEKERRDAFGDQPIEIDEESLKILKKDDDLYK